MSDEQRRPRPATQYGPTAEAVALNVKRLRERRGMTIYSLSGALTKAGRPITPSAIAKIERQQRQVTVDDLAALADVLDVSPSTLLLPQMPDRPVGITPAKTVPWQAAWRWLHGETPLDDDADDDSRESAERRRRFLAENQPYRDRSVLAEIARYIRARVEGPWHVELDYDGSREHGQIALRSEGQPKTVGGTGLTPDELAQALRDAGANIGSGPLSIRGYTARGRDQETQTDEGEGH